MDKAGMILRMLTRGINLEERAAEESASPKRFPCKRCGGEGWIFPTGKDGVTRAMRCPDCLAARENAQMLADSGVSLADYKKFTLENFRETTETARAMKGAAREFLKTGAGGIGFFGPSGIGKTHVCIAILRALNIRYKYWKYRQETQRIKNAMYRDSAEYERLMNVARKAPCLYIDDLFQGATDGGKLDRQDAQIMFDILDTRSMNRLRTLISSNCLLGEINSMNDAIASRIYALINPYAIEMRLGENARYGA